MPLSPGDKLGQFDVLSLLGRGGMGEVYRARDTQLKREVALKVLPGAFANDPERLARFQREAEVLASLNHPNIAAIYGVVQSGGAYALVMELVIGESPKGPMSWDDAWKLAQQMASALEYAHDKNIVHRDLKPANVMVTADGVLKLLDFGLAKAMSAPMSGSLDPENSPTLTMGATVAGTIMGTAGYMAPEQAKGKTVDKRADIWAFGVVLWELLTGERLFKGEDVADTLAQVLTKEVDVTRAPSVARRLLAECLQKDPKLRLRDIGDAPRLLGEVGSSAPPTTARKSWTPWVIAASLAIVTGVALWAPWRTRPAAAPDAQVMRFTIPPPADTLLTTRNTAATQQAISPDGRYIVFATDPAKGGLNHLNQVLWVRAIDSEKAQQLAGTERASQPFWSPDSKHIAYFADDKLKRVPTTGGSPLNLASVPNISVFAQGGAWFQNESAEGVILFAPNSSKIFRVPAAGGVPVAVTKLAEGETGHMYPQVLPDGKRFLYLARGAKPGIYVQKLGSEERTRLLEISTRAVFSPPDMLLYLQDSSLLAQRWDWSSLKPLGEPVQIADAVRNNGTNGRSSFSVSATGALVYREGLGSGTARYQWFSRDGKPQEYATPRLDVTNVELSPDRRQVLLRADRDLHVVDLGSGVISALTNDQPDESEPKWSPDGRRIVFQRPDGLYQMVVGSGKAAKFSTSTAYPEAWLPEGILVNDLSKLVLLPAPDENAAGPSGQTGRVLAELVCDEVRVAPGGKSVSYITTGSNGDEVWVADFPSFANRRKVADGLAPLWRPDGRELFYLDNNIVKSMDVTPGASLTFGPPRTLISAPGLAVAAQAWHQYAVSADGKRLLVRVNGNETGEVESLHVVLNWPALVK